MVTTLIWLKLLPCTLIPHKQYTGSSKCTFYPRMRFKQFPLGFALCPKGYFWVKKREKPFFFLILQKRQGWETMANTWWEGSEGVCVCAQSLSCVWHFAIPQTTVCQTPPSKGLSRQEYCIGLPLPLPGDLPDLGIEPTSPVSLALAGRFFTIPMMKCCYPYVYPNLRLLHSLTLLDWLSLPLKI